MADRVGQQLGSYQLLRLLGRGGFAEVYLGEHVRLNNHAAIKVLNTQLADSDAESFQREAYTIARLLHPHIIRVFDYDVAEGTPFLIMDYAPHGTLRDLHPKGTRFPLPSIVSYVKQVADALHYAHSQKVIHRDIKPENMLLGHNHEVLLSDFGIATMTQSSRYQHTQDIIGTAAYMPPEQLQGKPRPASDQYALGIVVYEWLSGERPFQGSFTEIASQHMFAPPPPLREKVAVLPNVEQVVMIALDKDPDRRFQSVQAFATAFEQACQSDEPTYFTPPPEVPTYLTPAGMTPPTISSPQPPVMATPYGQAVPPAPLAPAPEQLPLPQRGISRRMVVGGLAGVVGLVMATGGITWWALSHSPSVVTKPPSPTINPKPTNTPVPSTPTAPPVNGSWSPLSSLPSPEADNTAIYVRLQQRDYVYMTGGYRGNNNSPSNDDSLYRYDIAAQQWGTVTNSFPGMFNNAGARDEQNNLFFTAGYSSDTHYVTTLLYKYQPATGALQTITPPGQISFGYGGSMIADQNGHLYLTQGLMTPLNRDPNDTLTAGTGWYRYDIASDQWESLAPLPLGVAYVVLASDGQGGIVLLGGVTDTYQYHPTQGIYRYNVTNNAWQQEQATTPQAFNGSASCSVGNGRVVIVGGYDTGRHIALDTTWHVDLNTLHWTSLPSLPAGGSHLGTAACDGAGNVYVVRGVVNDPNQPTSDFWKLSLQT